MMNITKFEFVLLLILACAFPVRAAQVSNGTQPRDASRERPNVLFLFTDDQCFDTLGATGNEIIETPNIDQLAKQGVLLKNAYIMGGSSPAVCSPSRAILFSGRTLWNIECQGTYDFEISENRKTLPQLFRESGYVTWATGKNQPGRDGHFARSFSAGDKLLFQGMTNSQYKLPLFPFSPEGDYSNNKAVVHEGKHSAEIYADACIDFLENRKQSAPPFFSYVAFQTPHDPRQCPAEYLAKYKDVDIHLPKSFQPQHAFDNGMLRIRDEVLAGFPRQPDEVRRHIADYYAMIEHTDAQIGRIISTLKATGEYDNTIIVFTSDNGLAVGRHGLMGKQNVYDHSVHVPFIISGPGIPAGEQRDALCYIYDIFPTLCERAKIQTPAEVEFLSLNPLLADDSVVLRHHLYFAFMAWQRAIQADGFKLIEYCVKGKRQTQLFHLASDPDELVNLANDPAHVDRLELLRQLLEQESKRLNDGNTGSEFTSQMGTAFWKTYHAERKPQMKP